MKKVLILGSTGSIGKNVLKIISLHRDRFEVVGLTTKSNLNILAQQIKMFCPKYICITDEKVKHDGIGSIKFNKNKILFGESGLEEIIKLTKPDILVNAVVGFSGLKPLLCAIKNKVPKIALANKESIIVGGEIINSQSAIRNHKTKIIPVDSEHSAIFQCLKGEDVNKVNKIILTASGGPLFRKKRFDKKVESVINHPVWKMGKKISVDSATMVNKGFEYIEAHYLFNVPYKKIDIVVHPQSIIHSFVEFVDGAVLAMLSNPDMRIPISYALGFPLRIENKVKKIDVLEFNKLEFYKPDYNKFPLLKLLINCANAGTSYIIVFNAANEVVVQSFIDKKIGFDEIEKIIRRVVDMHKSIKINSLEEIVELDEKTRIQVNKLLN